MTQTERLMRLRVKLMRDPRFYAIAGVMMSGKCVFSKEVPTAGTNGLDVLINEEFFAGLTNEVALFVLAHEYYHVMLMHMLNYTDLIEEDAKTANMAMDLVINNMLDDAAGPRAGHFLEVWEHAFLDRQYAGLSTREVYHKLRQNKKQPKSANGGQGKPMDEHRPAQGESGQGEGKGTDVTAPVGAPLTPEQAKTVGREVDSAIRQATQMAGRTGAKIDRAISGMLEVTVPWEEQLQEFVKQQAAGNDLATWRKLSRRWMARDIKMPSHYSEKLARITIGVDTSGSIGDVQLRRALAEIKGACDVVTPEMVDVIYWDAEVAAHEIYEGDAVQTLVDATKPKGGGGTRVRSMLDYMKARDIKPDCIIVFTDGYVESDWGGDGWPAPVMWCVSTKGVTAPTGKSLFVPA